MCVVVVFWLLFCGRRGLYSYMCFPFSLSPTGDLGTVLRVFYYYYYFCNVVLYLWKLKKCFYHLVKWLWLLWVSMELHYSCLISWTAGYSLSSVTLMWKIMFETKWVVDFHFLQKVCGELLCNLLVCRFLSCGNFCVMCRRLKDCST